MNVRALLFIGLAFLAQGLGGVFVAIAAPLTNVQVYTSRQSTSLTTDVDIRFTMADAVNESADTIVLTIPSSFSLESLTASHIRLSHGATTGLETEETLAALAAAGVWGVDIVGHVITLTAPTDAGASEIGIGERVSIRFGIAYGGGAQITNPSVAGTYQWELGGTFGGTAYPFSPVVDSSYGGFVISFSVDEPPAAAVVDSGGGATGAVASTPPPPSAADTPPPPAAEEPATPPPSAADTPPPPATDPVSPPPSAADTPAPPTTTPGTGSAAPSSGGSTGSAGSSGSSGSGSSGSSGGGATTSGGGGSAPAPSSTVVSPIEGPASVEEEVLVPLVPTEPLPAEPSSPSTTAPISPDASSSVVRQGTVLWSLPGSLQIEQPRRLRLYVSDAADIAWTGLRPGSTAAIEVGSQVYVFNEREGRYVLRFSASSQAGTVQARLRTQYGQETPSFSALTIEQGGAFRVRAQKRDGTEEDASDTEVRISRQSGRSWTLAYTIKTGADGTLRVYLAAGTYRLEAKREGFGTLRQEITVPDGALFGDMTLKEGVQNPLNALDPNASFTENVANVAGATVEAVAQTLQEIRTPEVQVVAQVSAPIAVAASVGVTTAASSINLLNYLRFLFTQPLLLLRRRKREKWGLVYNAITKQPVDLAIIRLLDAKTNAVRQTRMSDAQGRFAFLVPAGEYRLQVVKPPFIFPSQTLAKETIDVDLVDLYHGEVIQATGSVTLTPNIPLDPVEVVDTPKEVIKKARWRKAQQGVSIGGLAVGALAFILQPTLFVGGLAAAQVGLFFLFRRLAVPRKPKNWGIAYDATTRKPLGKAIVRIFDKKYNKLLETQLTDSDGKYAFFAGKNVYYVTADREGYERATSGDIDLTKESLGVVREPIALTPKPSQTSA